MRLGILRATDCYSSEERPYLTRLSLVIPFPELPHLRQWTQVILTVRTRRQNTIGVAIVPLAFRGSGFFSDACSIVSPRH
jgi:hypothetical protein